MSGEQQLLLEHGYLVTQTAQDQEYLDTERPPALQCSVQGTSTSYATACLAGATSLACLIPFLALVVHFIKGYGEFRIRKVIVLLMVLFYLSTSVLTAISSWILSPSLTSATKAIMVSCSLKWTFTALLQCLSVWTLVAIVSELHDFLLHSPFSQLTGRRLFILLLFTSLGGMLFSVLPMTGPFSSYGLRLLGDNQTVVCSVRQTVDANR